MIFRQNGKVAFICRQNTGWYDGYYGLPGGKVDPGESFTHAAIREAEEEVGVRLTAANLDVVFAAHVKGEEADAWVNAVFEVRDWAGELINAEPHMSSELAWLDPNDLPGNVVPNSRFFLEQITAGQHYGERGWEA